MSLNASTLSAAVDASQTSIPITANTGAVTPNFTSGSTVAAPGQGYTYLYVDQEFMLIMELVSTTGLTVKRGQLGTKAASHSSGAVTNIGYPGDFANQPIGSFTYQPLYGVPPVPWRASASQAAAATTVSISGSSVGGGTVWGFSTSTQANALVTLANELRAALVAAGLIKGSA